MGMLIGAYFVIVILETDTVAKNETPPMWTEVASWIVLAVFLVEIYLHLFVERLQYFATGWNVFEFLIVVADLCASVASLFLAGESSGVGALRLLRLTRLARASKLFREFPELRLMVVGLAGAMRPIFWGTVFLMSTLLMWSVVAVQFIHPLNLQIAATGYYDNCERCPRAFESTFSSTITFWQQIVAGDGWGSPTVPIIEHFPWTALYFSAVFLSVGMAIMNLILGVVVNVATESSDKFRHELETEHWLASHQELTTIFEQLDQDHDAMLSKEELMAGFRENHVFREYLQSMDVQEQDLDILWTHLDSDQDGSVTAREFIHQICAMQQNSSYYMMLYIKHYISHVRKDIGADVKELKKSLQADIHEVEEIAEQVLKESVDMHSDMERQISQSSSQVKSRACAGGSADGKWTPPPDIMERDLEGHMSKSSPDGKQTPSPSRPSSSATSKEMPSHSEATTITVCDIPSNAEGEVASEGVACSLRCVGSDHDTLGEESTLHTKVMETMRASGKLYINR
jgi:voltage-gated sodium channel